MCVKRVVGVEYGGRFVVDLPVCFEHPQVGAGATTVRSLMPVSFPPSDGEWSTPGREGAILLGRKRSDDNAADSRRTSSSTDQQAR